MVSDYANRINVRANAKYRELCVRFRNNVQRLVADIGRVKHYTKQTDSLSAPVKQQPMQPTTNNSGKRVTHVIRRGPLKLLNKYIFVK